MMLSGTNTMAVRKTVGVHLPPRPSTRQQRFTVLAATNSTSTSSPVSVPTKITRGAQGPLSILTKPATAAVSLGAAFTAFAAAALPALANTLSLEDPIDPIFKSDFDVSFLGYSMDHKVIIYLIIFGQFVGLVGSTVSGLDARRSKEEVQGLNSRLVKVNSDLRKLAREGKQGMYAHPEAMSMSKAGMSEEDVSLRDRVIGLLRAGKKHLKDGEPKMAESEFTLALQAVKEAGRALEDPWKAERKAFRGLGSACVMMGQHQKALQHMLKVLEICEVNDGDEESNTVGDAMGVVADIYTELGDMEEAAKYYDKYLGRLAME